MTEEKRWIGDKGGKSLFLCRDKDNNVKVVSIGIAKILGEIFREIIEILLIPPIVEMLFKDHFEEKAEESDRDET